MKKILLLLSIAFVIASCSQDKTAETEQKAEQTTFSGKKIPVRTALVETSKFSHYFEAAGELESINEAFISPETSGQITDIKVKEGQTVKKGQVLAKLNTSLIEKNIKEVKTSLNFAKVMFEKQSQLWEKNIGSELQYLEAKNNFETLTSRYESLQAQYNMSIIKAPFDGHIEEITLKKGELASPGMGFMQLVDIKKLILKANLSEAYLAAVNKGDVVEVIFPSYPDLKINAEVSRTGNVINKQNRTFVVEVKLNNFENRLKPNMLANVIFNDYTSDNSIVVPSILVKHDMKGKYLFVLTKKEGDNISTKRYVETGRTYKDKTEIISGLKAGETIITDGYNNVSDGSIVNIIK